GRRQDGSGGGLVRGHDDDPFRADQVAEFFDRVLVLPGPGRQRGNGQVLTVLPFCVGQPRHQVGDVDVGGRFDALELRVLVEEGGAADVGGARELVGEQVVAGHVVGDVVDAVHVPSGQQPPGGHGQDVGEGKGAVGVSHAASP